MITRRTFLGAGLGMASAAYLTACGTTTESTGPSGETEAPSPAGSPQPPAQGPIEIRLPGNDVNFPSPFSYGGGIGYIQAAYTYDTLMWKDGTGAYIPWLATGFDRSDDGLSYTFQLREGVTWSDDEPFTAEDVAFTFDYLEEHRAQLAPTVITTPTPENIESVSAIDTHVVEFRLREPDWTFEQFTGAGGVFIMPKHVWSGIDEPGAQNDPELLVGTGPYRLESMDLGAGAYLYVAREDYFLGNPLIQRIEHVPVGDPLNALLAGDIHQAGGVGPGTGLRPQAVEPFENSDEFRVMDAPAGHTVTALYWNIEAGGALADPRFRQACAYAIDRQDLVDRLFDGHGAPGNPGLIPPGNPFHTDVEQYGYDVARAEELLDEAGYERPGPDQVREGPDGPLSFELLISSAQPEPPVQLVVAALAEIGVEATPVTVDLPTFGERRNAGQTELSINTFGGTNTDEQPDGMGKVYASTSRSLQRAQGYSNGEVDELIAEQRRALDEDERTRIAHQIQEAVAADLPLLPLFYPPLTTIVRTDPFDGWFDTPGGVGGLVPHVNNKLAFVTGSSEAPA
ncbi:ABC transporter substrate-binding protein [Phytoactinopolyspora mesophila]|nr:ABC transporter substrate-binding protein [Phytoactinopolyspora mesophila]